MISNLNFVQQKEIGANEVCLLYSGSHPSSMGTERPVNFLDTQTWRQPWCWPLVFQEKWLPCTGGSVELDLGSARIASMVTLAECFFLYRTKLMSNIEVRKKLRLSKARFQVVFGQRNVSISSQT